MRALVLASSSLSLVLIGGALPSSATTCVVRPDGTGDFPTIQEAINHVLSGDTIELTDGVFSGNGNRDLDYLGKAIVIRSSSGNPDQCILDCEGSESAPHRGVWFDAGEGANSILQGVTIRNGVAAGQSAPAVLGGAVLITNNSRPTLIDVVFSDNSARSGGAIGILQGGGGFTRCRFIRNIGWWGTGGGVWGRSCTAMVDDCVFVSNRSHQAGGGATFSSSPDVTVRRCWFERNQVDWGYGAGLDFWWDTTGRVEDCSFWGNFSDDSSSYGAGFHGTRCTAVVHGCTFVGNRAGAGSAIGVESTAGIMVENSLLALNLGSPAVHCHDGTPELSCSDIFGNTGGDWVGCIAAQNGMDGNISADPLLCDAANGDLRLHGDSPCAPEHSPAGCGLIGAQPVACGATAIEPTTWGAIKVQVRPAEKRPADSLRLPEGGRTGGSGGGEYR